MRSTPPTYPLISFALTPNVEHMLHMTGRLQHRTAKNTNQASVSQVLLIEQNQTQVQKKRGFFVQKNWVMKKNPSLKPGEEHGGGLADEDEQGLGPSEEAESSLSRSLCRSNLCLGTLQSLKALFELSVALPLSRSLTRTHPDNLIDTLYVGFRTGDHNEALP